MNTTYTIQLQDNSPATIKVDKELYELAKLELMKDQELYTSGLQDDYEGSHCMSDTSHYIPIMRTKDIKTATGTLVSTPLTLFHCHHLSP